MEEISAFRRQLETHRPADWETLPDFPLYMDQVLSYICLLYTSDAADEL